MNKSAEDFLEGATQGATIWIRVVGRGSFKLSSTLKTFVGTAVQRGFRQVLMDMQDCTGMDSTFMGVMAGLALLLQPQQGTVGLVNLSDKNRASLTTLGLSSLLRLHDTIPTDIPRPTMQRLEPSLDMAHTAANILAAHETLITAAPENQPKFQNLITELRDEIQRKP